MMEYELKTQEEDRQLFYRTLERSINDHPHFHFFWEHQHSLEQEYQNIAQIIRTSWGVHYSTLLQKQWFDEFQRIKLALQKRTDCQQFKVSLNTVTTDQCPIFHTDKISLRLICTYVGPGTQMLSGANANHCALGKGDNYKIVRNWAKVIDIPTREYCFLEGDLHPQRYGKGVIHRSPPIEKRGLSRLVLVIDEYRERII